MARGRKMAILITGGSGFIGTNFIHEFLPSHDELCVNLDALTYAGNENNHENFTNHKNYKFIKGNINDTGLIKEILRTHNIRAIFHFAAESHVDRSIDSPLVFIETNINGSFSLLEATRSHLSEFNNPDFRFIHVSTDEVYGSLQLGEAPFAETRAYQPNSPYAASKAASDLLMRAYFHTYKLPIITTNCSNNYGPYQFAEKLIPLMIHQAIKGEILPVYGDGGQIRDWLFVKDHCQALLKVWQYGILGEAYCIGGNNERTNMQVVQAICDYLDKIRPRKTSYSAQITHVKDRLGHDRRYAINAEKIAKHCDWRAKYDFESGLKATINWYLNQIND